MGRKTAGIQDPIDQFGSDDFGSRVCLIYRRFWFRNPTMIEREGEEGEKGGIQFVLYIFRYGICWFLKRRASLNEWMDSWWSFWSDFWPPRQWVGGSFGLGFLPQIHPSEYPSEYPYSYPSGYASNHPVVGWISFLSSFPCSSFCGNLFFIVLAFGAWRSWVSCRQITAAIHSSKVASSGIVTALFSTTRKRRRGRTQTKRKEENKKNYLFRALWSKDEQSYICNRLSAKTEAIYTDFPYHGPCVTFPSQFTYKLSWPIYRFRRLDIQFRPFFPNSSIFHITRFQHYTVFSLHLI